MPPGEEAAEDWFRTLGAKRKKNGEADPDVDSLQRYLTVTRGPGPSLRVHISSHRGWLAFLKYAHTVLTLSTLLLLCLLPSTFSSSSILTPLLSLF